MYLSSRIRKILLLLCLLALVAGAAANTNTVQLFVHPGSGTVCLDSQCRVNVGTLSGYSSVQFGDVASGQDHTIRVYDTAGYEDYTDTVYMDLSGHSFTSRIYLEPVSITTPPPGTGDIQVFVSPGLGQVCLDNRECESSVGDVTTTWSVRFSDVSSDTPHTLTATADGYLPYTTTVGVQPAGISDVDITLQPAASAPAGDQPASIPPQPTKAAPGFPLFLIAAALAGTVLVCRKPE
jgi:hypothetical protein